MEIGKGLRGARTDLESIWSVPFCTHVEGERIESFCLDAEGLLVQRCGQRGLPSTLIPYAVQAWQVDSVALDRLKSELKKKLNSVFTPESLQGLYRNGLYRFPQLYAAGGSLYAEEGLLRAAIEAYQEGDSSLKGEIESELAGFGLYPFFSTENLGPEYFQYEGRQISKGVVSEPGWVNQRSVFSKSKIV